MSPIVISTVPGRLVVPAITISPTSTSRSITTPAIGAVMRVRSRSFSVDNLVALYSRNWKRPWSSDERIFSTVVRASAISVGVENPRSASFSSPLASRSAFAKSAWAAMMAARTPSIRASIDSNLAAASWSSSSTRTVSFLTDMPFLT